MLNNELQHTPYTVATAGGRTGEHAMCQEYNINSYPESCGAGDVWSGLDFTAIGEPFQTLGAAGWCLDPRRDLQHRGKNFTPACSSELRRRASLHTGRFDRKSHGKHPLAV